jgi:hypothetical protein
LTGCRQDQAFNIVDIKPQNMEDLTEVGGVGLPDSVVELVWIHSSMVEPRGCLLPDVDNGGGGGGGGRPLPGGVVGNALAPAAAMTALHCRFVVPLRLLNACCSQLSCLPPAAGKACLVH